MPMQIFGGLKMCIVGLVQVVNWENHFVRIAPARKGYYYMKWSAL